MKKINCVIKLLIALFSLFSFMIAIYYSIDLEIYRKYTDNISQDPLYILATNNNYLLLFNSLIAIRYIYKEYKMHKNKI